MKINNSAPATGITRRPQGGQAPGQGSPSGIPQGDQATGSVSRDRFISTNNTFPPVGTGASIPAQGTVPGSPGYQGSDNRFPPIRNPQDAAELSKKIERRLPTDNRFPPIGSPIDACPAPSPSPRPPIGNGLRPIFKGEVK